MMRTHSSFERRWVSVIALLCPLAWATGCSDDETALEASDDDGGSTPEPTTSPTTGVGGDDDGVATSEPGGTTSGESSEDDSGSDTGVGTGGGESGETGPDPTAGGSGLCLGGAFEGVNARVFSATDGRPFEGTCEATPAPCDGDPIGTWAVEAWCGDPAVNPFAADCPSSTFTVEVVDVSGTRTLDADNSYSEDITTVTESTLVIDSQDCLALTCGQLEAQLVEDFPGIDCATSAGECTCELSATRTSTAQGTWELAGGVLGLTAEDGGVETFSICVTDGAMQTWEEVYSAVPTDTPCDAWMDCVDALGDAYESYVCVDGAG